MSEVARRRDWLAELRGATKDLDSFKKLVTVVAKEAPGLREEVCRLASELPGGIGEWTDEAFFAEEVLREAHKAEALFFGPEIQPRVEDSKPTTTEQPTKVEGPTTPKTYRRRLVGNGGQPAPKPPE